jgi:hypothetical protein
VGLLSRRGGWSRLVFPGRGPTDASGDLYGADGWISWIENCLPRWAFMDTQLAGDGFGEPVSANAWIC